MKVNLAFDTEASPKDVHDVISDLTFLKQVDADVTKMERLFDGPIEVGSTFREHLALPGLPIVADLTLTELNPDAVAFAFQSKQMKGSGRFAITATDGGSHVALEVRANMRGLWNLMWPMVRIEFPMRERKRLGNLENLLAP